MKGSVLSLSSLSGLALRASPSGRMRLRRYAAVLGLDPIMGRSTKIHGLRRLPNLHGQQWQIHPPQPNNISAFGLNLSLAPATGGGCVYQGPFVNYTVDLGPVVFNPVDGDGGLDYNPRCLGRDLSLVWSNQTKPTDVVRTISSCADLGCFDTVLEAIDGIHAGGHFTIGSLNDDAYASAGDPVFWLHHSQIDRVWTIWQSLNPANRTSQVYGTSTAFNSRSQSRLRYLQLAFMLMDPILQIHQVQT